MKVVLIFICMVVSCSATAAQTKSENSIIAKTEPPALLDGNGGVSFA